MTSLNNSLSLNGRLSISEGSTYNKGEMDLQALITIANIIGGKHRLVEKMKSNLTDEERMCLTDRYIIATEIESINQILKEKGSDLMVGVRYINNDSAINIYYYKNNVESILLGNRPVKEYAYDYRAELQK